MTVLVSHVGTCYLGVNVDIDAVREPELFDACQHQGFAMVLGLAQERWPTARLTVIPERFDAGTSSGRRREQGKLRLPRSSRDRAIAVPSPGLAMTRGPP
jgi:hypothetical protein